MKKSPDKFERKENNIFLFTNKTYLSTHSVVAYFFGLPRVAYLRMTTPMSRSSRDYSVSISRVPHHLVDSQCFFLINQFDVDWLLEIDFLSLKDSLIFFWFLFIRIEDRCSVNMKFRRLYITDFISFRKIIRNHSCLYLYLLHYNFWIDGSHSRLYLSCWFRIMKNMYSEFLNKDILQISFQRFRNLDIFEEIVISFSHFRKCISLPYRVGPNMKRMNDHVSTHRNNLILWRNLLFFI